MKKIEMLVDMIDEELEGAKTYIKKALDLKEKDRELAETFYRLSNEEMTHVDALHKRVVEIIMDYKRKNGEPPPVMEALYDYLHKRHVAKAEKSPTCRTCIRSNLPA